MSLDTMIHLAVAFITGISIIASVIWQLSRSENRIIQLMADQRAELQKLIDDRGAALYRDLETDRRITGDAMQAVRAAIANLEIKTLETFVRRDSFHKFLDTMSEARRAFEDDIKERLKDMQQKLDRIVERDNVRAPRDA